MTNQNDGGKYIPGYEPPAGTHAAEEKRQREQAERDRRDKNYQDAKSTMQQGNTNNGSGQDSTGCLIIFLILGSGMLSVAYTLLPILPPL